jgi:hypothetical protein
VDISPEDMKGACTGKKYNLQGGDFLSCPGRYKTKSIPLDRKWFSGKNSYWKRLDGGQRVMLKQFYLDGNN